MRKPRFPDVVRLKEAVVGRGEDDDFSDVTVMAGELGTIIEEFDTPAEAYEVEFVADDGETWATVTVTPDQFEVVYPLGKRVPEQVGA